MSMYRVVVPVAGYVEIEIEADSPEDAVKKTAHEVGAKITDLNGYEGTDVNPAEGRVWVPESDSIQVTDEEAPEENNLTLIKTELFHLTTKGQYK